MVGTATRAPPDSNLSAKSESRPAVVEAAVHVCGGHVDQPLGLPDAGHLDDDPHGEGGGVSATAVEHLPIAIGQLEGHRSGMMARLVGGALRRAKRLSRSCR